MSVFTPTPAWAIDSLNRHSAGQQVRLVIVEGSGEDWQLLSCVHKMASSQYPESIRQPILTTDDGSKILTATNQISGELAAVIDGLSSMFLDQLYAAGMIDETTPSKLAWPLVIKEQAARGFYGLQLQQYEANDCRVSIIDGFVYASTLLLEQLQNVDKQQNKPTENPTSEQQTSKKVTRTEPNKADKWLKILEDYYRRDITTRLKESGEDPTPEDIEHWVTKEVRCKGRHELREMIAALPAFKGEDPPQSLAIKEGRSAVYDSWKKYRSTPGRKKPSGNLEQTTAAADGLAVRRESEGYQEHTAETADSDALTDFYDNLMRDPASIDRPAALREFQILLKRQGSSLNTSKEMKAFREFLNGLETDRKNVDI